MLSRCGGRTDNALRRLALESDVLITRLLAKLWCIGKLPWKDLFCRVSNQDRIWWPQKALTSTDQYITLSFQSIYLRLSPVAQLVFHLYIWLFHDRLSLSRWALRESWNWFGSNGVLNFPANDWLSVDRHRRYKHNKTDWTKVNSRWWGRFYNGIK